MFLFAQWFLLLHVVVVRAYKKKYDAVCEYKRWKCMDASYFQKKRHQSSANVFCAFLLRQLRSIFKKCFPICSVNLFDTVSVFFYIPNRSLVAIVYFLRFLYYIFYLCVLQMCCSDCRIRCLMTFCIT